LVQIKEQNAWKKAYNVLYFSLEMPKTEIIDRVISNMANVDSLDLGKGTIKPDEINGIKSALYYFENSPSRFRVIDMPRDCSMAQIQKIYDNVKMEMDVDLIIIDYLD
jgi:replicative DNA helicase